MDNNITDRSAKSPSDSTGKFCEGCAILKAEIEMIKREIAELRKFNSPAEKQPCTSKVNMQIIQCLERNNTSLIAAVEALSRQVLSQRSPELATFESLSDERRKYSKSASSDVEILESAKIQQLKCTGADQTSTHIAEGSKKGRKKRKKKTAKSASLVSQTTSCDLPRSSNGNE